MNALRTLALLLLLFATGTPYARAQAQQLEHMCSLYLSPEHVSDGQEYIAQLKPDQNVEFRTTFFSGTTYRIVACSTIRKGDLVFSVYDTEKNLLFSNSCYSYSPFWDFKFTSTVTCTIQVRVQTEKFTPGYVMLLIGFKP